MWWFCLILFLILFFVCFYILYSFYWSFYFLNWSTSGQWLCRGPQSLDGLSSSRTRHDAATCIAMVSAGFLQVLQWPGFSCQCLGRTTCRIVWHNTWLVITWRSESMTLAEFLRKTNDEGHIHNSFRKPHKTLLEVEKEDTALEWINEAPHVDDALTASIDKSW